MIIAAENDTAALPHSEVQVSTLFGLRSRLVAAIDVAEAVSPANRVVTLQAALVLDGLMVRVVTRQGGPGGAERGRESVSVFALTPAQRKVAALAAPCTCHGREGSRLALRAVDQSGRPLGPERDLGEVRIGRREIGIPILEDVRASLQVAAEAWSEREGVAVRLRGAVTLLHGISLRLQFRPTGPEAAAGRLGSIECLAARPGTSLFGEKYDLRGLAPATEIRAQFLDGEGRAIDGERSVGRCALVVA